MEERDPRWADSFAVVRDHEAFHEDLRNPGRRGFGDVFDPDDAVVKFVGKFM